jgi:hypothetical protein
MAPAPRDLVNLHALPSETFMASTRGWKLPVDLIRDWRWRCLGDGLSIAGADLWIGNGNGGGLVRLSESADKLVDRYDLRHACGSPVLPVSARED